ncbi:MAG: bleomycin resistance protein [Gemmatirosa sp.]
MTEPTLADGRAEPILPARDLPEIRAFYERLGFDTGYWDPDPDAGYLILTRGGLRVHFFAHRTLVPEENFAGCYWRVADADAWHRHCAALDLPTDGIPRLTAPDDRPWGMREFALVDPSGNLVRIGHEPYDHPLDFAP